MSKFLAVSVLVSSAAAARAEVLNAAPNGFTVRHEVAVEAERLTVYETAVGGVGQWWSSDHTVSGDAANLSITPTVPGCFCEALGPDAGLVHMTVSFVNPGVMIRLTGGLGPLGLMGVSGNMTWEFEQADSGTLVILQYAVGGYMDGGLDTVAPAVDGVLGEAMMRLKSYVESGDPAQG
jgi:hypothetical protein